jgi:hypothetical protein
MLRIGAGRVPLKAKRAGIVCEIYRWKLTASRSHVGPQQNYAVLKKCARGEMKIIVADVFCRRAGLTFCVAKVRCGVASSAVGEGDCATASPSTLAAANRSGAR